MQSRREQSMRGAVILVYHGVAHKLKKDDLDTYQISQTELRRHIRYLKHLADVVSIRELILNGEQILSSKQRVAAISFDDALVSQVTLAADVMGEFRMPWSIAVPAGLVEQQQPVWTNLVRFIARMLPPDKLRLCDGQVLGAALLRHAGAGLIQFLLNEVSSNDRDQQVQLLLNEVGAERVHATMAADRRFLMASWQQLRDVSRAGCEILVHGWNHRPHNSTLTEPDRLTEIVDSRRLIEQRLGVAPIGFAYPHGITGSCSERVLANAGYQFAFSTRGSWFDQRDQWNVPRFDGEYPLNVLRRHLTWRQ